MFNEIKMWGGGGGENLQGTDNNTVTIYHLRIDILTYYNNNDNKKKMRIMQGRGKYFR